MKKELEWKLHRRIIRMIKVRLMSLTGYAISEKGSNTIWIPRKSVLQVKYMWEMTDDQKAFWTKVRQGTFH